MLLSKISAIITLTIFSVAISAQSTDIFTYPSAGQSQQQMEQDRYECYRWAVSTTGTDPATLSNPVTTTVPTIVENKNRGDAAKGTIIGTVAGAIIGSTLDSGRHRHRRHQTASGAIVGAAVGGIIGSSREKNGYQNAAIKAKKTAAHQQQEQANYEYKIDNYIRAFSACMEGRSYSVK